MSTLSDKSRYLSLLLRHKPEMENLHMSKDGYVEVRELLSQFSISELKEIVSKDKKGRYEFSEDNTKIRAVYGHSIDVDIEYEVVSWKDVPVLYHGTTARAYKSIKQDGYILPRSRKFVHLSKDLDTALNVASRHGIDVVVLRVDCKRLSKNYKFFKARGTNTYLAKRVPFEVVSKL